MVTVHEASRYLRAAEAQIGTAIVLYPAMYWALAALSHGGPIQARLIERIPHD